MPMIRHAFLLVLAAIAALLPAEAFAACAMTGTVSTSLGTTSSYNVQTGPFSRVQSAAGFNCTGGSLITILSTNRAVATLTSTNIFKLKKAGSTDSINYTVSADAGGTIPFATNGSSVDYMASSNLTLLGILTGTNFNPSIYVLPAVGANVSAGTYTDTIRMDWDWVVCRGVNLLGICILADTGTGSALVTVTLTVSADCRISVQNISFGTAALVDQFSTQSGSFGVDCSKGSTYFISVTAGNSSVSRPWRKMSNGSGGTLQYNIYWPDGTTIWDSTTPVTGSTGTGASSPAYSYGFKAKINPTQTPVAAGHYTDLVSVTVSF